MKNVLGITLIIARSSAFVPHRRLISSTTLRKAVNEISAQDLKQLFGGNEVPAAQSVLTMDGVQMIDVREPDELMVANYPKPGMDSMGDRPMQHLPLSTMNEWAPKAVDGSLLDKSKPVVVACKVGGRSMQVCRWLDDQGYEEVYNLAGGINKYSSVDPSVGGPY
eukprot:CAMPEP_0172633662 /NCGR_PEP_ID=MMETSP1068-20121228/190626_1 /TAXON_ID=35684 /ORGANISM="Pseudopedinella elastica, Strain CCMP716" /LENGTH=164 /DNA_ID=CAMNT_0013445423 /DNA_START=66 /DNA_END=560 /DNA_ORIENTATION=-